jgi:hypothetical protein
MFSGDFSGYNTPDFSRPRSQDDLSKNLTRVFGPPDADDPDAFVTPPLLTNARWAHGLSLREAAWETIASPAGAGVECSIIMPNRFSLNLSEFWRQREKLPFDEHWFLALPALGPSISLEGETDTICCRPRSGSLTSRRSRARLHGLEIRACVTDHLGALCAMSFRMTFPPFITNLTR